MPVSPLKSGLGKPRIQITSYGKNQAEDVITLLEEAYAVERNPSSGLCFKYDESILFPDKRVAAAFFSRCYIGKVLKFKDTVSAACFVALSQYPVTKRKFGVIVYCGVKPEYQNIGIGCNLLAEVERCLIVDHNVNETVLKVPSSRSDILQFMKKRGYSETGVEDYPVPEECNTKQVLVVMRKRLGFGE